jgi:hypothetical protein
LGICCVIAAAAQPTIATYPTDTSVPPLPDSQPTATKEKSVETIQGVVILRGSVTLPRSAR